MRRPRFRLVTLMLVVALLAIGLWVGLIWTRAEGYRARANAFAASYEQILAEGEKTLLEIEDFQRFLSQSEDPDERELLRRGLSKSIERTETLSRLAEWCDAMEGRYRDAARRPWIRVEEIVPPPHGGIKVSLPPPR